MGAANLIGVQTARRYRAVPVGYVDEETVILAMADPANVLAIDDVQMMTGLNCRVAVAAEVDIEALIGRLNTLETSVAEAVEEDGEEERPRRRRHLRPARVGRRRAGDQARLLDPRPGGGRGRLRHPLRARGEGDAGPLPGRRRALRGRPGPEADDLRRRQPGEDHERPRHRRKAGPAGRPRRPHGRGPQGRSARGHDADPEGRGLHGPDPRQVAGPAIARRPRHGGRAAGPLPGGVPPAARRRARHRADRLGQVDDAVLGARSSSTRSARTSSRSRIRSSTGSPASTR